LIILSNQIVFLILIRETLNSRPQLRQDYALNLSISLSAGKKLTRMPLVTASEAGRAQI